MRVFWLVLIGVALAGLLGLWLFFQVGSGPQKGPDCIKHQDTVPC